MSYYKEAYINDHGQILIIERDMTHSPKWLEVYNISPFTYYTWPESINKCNFPTLKSFIDKVTEGQKGKDVKQAALNNDYIIWPLAQQPWLKIEKCFDDETCGVCWITKSNFRKAFRMQRVTKESIQFSERVINSDLRLNCTSNEGRKFRYTLLGSNRGPVLAEDENFFGGDMSLISDMYRNGLALSANKAAKDGNWRLADAKMIYYIKK